MNGVDSGLEVLKSVPGNTMASYVIIAIPLFLLMTALIQQSGIAQSVYLASARCFRHLPGGRTISSIAACALNATVSVSSQSIAAVVGSVALPQKKKESPDFSPSVSAIVAGSTIALLIPPGLGSLVYALLLNLSIIKVFFAGLIPGILLSCFFLLYAAIAGRSRKKDKASRPAPSAKRSLSGFLMLLPVGIWVIFFGCMGILHLGVAVLIAFIWPQHGLRYGGSLL